MFDWYMCSKVFINKTHFTYIETHHPLAETIHHHLQKATLNIIFYLLKHINLDVRYIYQNNKIDQFRFPYHKRIVMSVAVVQTKSDSDVTLSLHMLSKTLKCTLYLG